MIFVGHFIAIDGLMFSEYKFPKATFYFFNDNVFHITCSVDEYMEFINNINKSPKEETK